MHTFCLPVEFVKRFSDYRSSRVYREVPDYAKSGYWRYHADAIHIHVSGHEVAVKGLSGYYFPPEKGLGVVKRLRRILRFVSSFKNRGERLFNYFEAFDRVMSNDPVAKISLSPGRINFKNLRDRPGVISSTADMAQEFFAKDRYDLHPHLIKSFYYQNIIRSYLDVGGIRTVLEIGAGSGNLASLIYHYLNRPRIMVVDLPETLCLSMLFVAKLFPEATIRMPHEVDDGEPGQDDFTFLTCAQIGRIRDDSVDLAINTESFQEMTHRQIEEYFRHVQRCCKNGAHFFTCNRVEKIPAAFGGMEGEAPAPVNRFAEYPWNAGNQVIIYEICRLRRLTQLDDVYLRLERIQK